MKKRSLLLLLTTAVLFSCANNNSVNVNPSSESSADSVVSSNSTGSSITSSTATSSESTSVIAPSSSGEDSSASSSSSVPVENQALKLLKQKFNEDFSFLKDATLTDNKVTATVTNPTKYIALGKMGWDKYHILADGSLFYAEYGDTTLTVTFYSKEDLSSSLPVPDTLKGSKKLYGYKISDTLLYVENSQVIFDYYVDVSYRTSSTIIYKDTMLSFTNSTNQGTLVTVSKKTDLKSIEGNSVLPDIQGFIDMYGNYLIPMTEDEFISYVDQFSLTFSYAYNGASNYPCYRIYSSDYGDFTYCHGYLEVAPSSSNSGSFKIRPLGSSFDISASGISSAFGYQSVAFDTSDEYDTYLSTNYDAIGSSSWYVAKNKKTLAYYSSSSSSEKGLIKNKINKSSGIDVVPNIREETGYEDLLSYIGVVKADSLYIAMVSANEDNSDVESGIDVKAIYSAEPQTTSGHYGFIPDSSDDSSNSLNNFVKNLETTTYTYSTINIVTKVSKEDINFVLYSVLGSNITMTEDLDVYLQYSRPTFDDSIFTVYGSASEIQKFATLLSLTAGTPLETDYGKASYDNGQIVFTEGQGSNICGCIENIEAVLGVETNLVVSDCTYSSWNISIADSSVYASFLNIVQANATSIDDSNTCYYTSRGVITITESSGTYTIATADYDNFNEFPTKVNDVTVIGLMAEGTDYAGYFYNTPGMLNLIETTLTNNGYTKNADGKWYKGIAYVTVDTTTNTKKINVTLTTSDYCGPEGLYNKCLKYFATATGKMLYIPSSWNFSTTSDNEAWCGFTLTVPTEKADTLATRLETILGTTFSEGVLTKAYTDYSYTVTRSGNAFSFTKVFS